MRKVACIIFFSLFLCIPAYADQGLRAANITDSSVNLIWDDMGSLNYTLLLNGQIVAETMQKKCSITGLQPETQYNLKLVWDGGEDEINITTARPFGVIVFQELMVRVFNYLPEILGFIILGIAIYSWELISDSLYIIFR